MARASGKAGTVTIATCGPGAYNGVTSWEIDYKGDAIDVTGMSDAGVKAFIAGLTEWSGTVDLNWDTAQAAPTPALAGTISAVTGATGAYDTWAGAIIVTSAKVTIPVDGACKLSIAFQGTGVLSIT